MRISELKYLEFNGRTRLSAVAKYEDLDKPEVHLFFEVDAENRNLIEELYEPFLLSCFPAALFHGEERIFIDGAICPELKSNVSAAIHLQKMWFGGKTTPIVESSETKIRRPSSQKTACLISGGVDSLSTFCRNISLYHRDDPRRISHGIFAYGLDVGNPELRDRFDIFDKSKELLRAFLKKYGCNLIPIYTNARDIEPHGSFYATRQFGALLSGIAHSVSGDFGRCIVALDTRVDHFDEWGSHPWLNKYYSSSNLDFISKMDSYTRLEKYKFIADYPESLNALRVCYTTDNISEGRINCGQCKKCLRTKIELLASGLQDKVNTFEQSTLTAEKVKSISAFHPHEEEFLGEPAKKLRKMGRSDIADILEQRIKEMRRRVRRKSERDYVFSMIKSFDEAFLMKAISRTYKFIRKDS